MEVFNLFPTAVAKFDLENPLSNKLLSTVKNLNYIRNEMNFISSDKYVLNLPELKELRKFIESSVQEYFKNVMCMPDLIRPYITISWTNINERGHGHHKHTHPNSIVSGVFYVQTTDEDKIHFSLPQTPREIKLPKPVEFNPSNSETWWLPASQNTLYLFPSTLTHYVESIDTDRTRISLSFNTFVHGFCGSEEDATALHLNFNNLPF
jgi:uncharacterized protein (TIGR02466 family)